jgi:hypothetical protein
MYKAIWKYIIYKRTVICVETEYPLLLESDGRRIIVN